MNLNTPALGPVSRKIWSNLIRFEPSESGLVQTEVHIFKPCKFFEPAPA